MFITVSGHATDLGKGLAVVQGSLITIAVGHRRYMYTLHSISSTECMGGNFDGSGANLSLPYLAGANIRNISQCHNLM